MKKSICLYFLCTRPLNLCPSQFFFSWLVFCQSLYCSLPHFEASREILKREEVSLFSCMEVWLLSFGGYLLQVWRTWLFLNLVIFINIIFWRANSVLRVLISCGLENVITLRERFIDSYTKISYAESQPKKLCLIILFVNQKCTFR